MRSVPTLALTAALGVVGLALAPAASAADQDATVHYLAEQLAVGDNRLVVESGGMSYDDLGMTIDAVLGMTASGTGGDASAAATDYIVANAGTYYGTGDEVYSAATAKLLTFASARNLNPRDVGGVDLVAKLRSLEQSTGQFADQSQWGDYSNTLGQSFALIGLERAGVNPSSASVDFLLQQQCDDGGFSLQYTDGCVSDPDATSLAVQALGAIGGQGAAVQEAADFLIARQDANGGIGGGATTEGINANSTGLAAVALGVAGRDAARAAAVDYVRSLTFGCDTPALTGAIAYNQADFDAAVAQGADARPDGTITRTTTQAIMALTNSTYATVTAQGQTAATPATGCAPATDEPTDEGTGDADTGSVETPAADDEATPERPAVVQTDGVTTTAPNALLALGGGAAAAAIVLVIRRRPALQRH